MSQGDVDLTNAESFLVIAPKEVNATDVQKDTAVEVEAVEGGVLGVERTEEEDRQKQMAAMRLILDQQSIMHFSQYAQEQHPKDGVKREELIRQMQDQYFEYYMGNVQHSQAINQQRQIDQLIHLRESSLASLPTGEDVVDDDDGEPIPLPLIPASMWTRKDIVDFKKIILADHRECCIKISSLASATLRVPTHEGGSSIFWEFATDSYDLGFGLFFEWNLAPQENITMTISESSDEDDDEEEDEENEEGIKSDSSSKPRDSNSIPDEADVESGSGSRKSRKLANSPPTDELIPVYRRDCHTEVYCGSHQYPGCGVYVFKFDNSFSLWRSKWLYYQIFYGK